MELSVTTKAPQIDIANEDNEESPSPMIGGPQIAIIGSDDEEEKK